MLHRYAILWRAGGPWYPYYRQRTGARRSLEQICRSDGTTVFAVGVN